MQALPAPESGWFPCALSIYLSSHRLASVRFKGSSRRMLRTPVAFLNFNRPDTTATVFAAIAKARPATLLVVADGPRASRSGEAQLCAAAREVIRQVDWPCRVLTNFSDHNLGCRRRVSSGIDWVFSLVEEAIFLGDRVAVMTRGPGRIRTIVDVPFDREARAWSLLNADPVFASLREKLLDLVRTDPAASREPVAAA